MKAENIVAIDIKTAQEVLNYQGPVFSNLAKKELSNIGKYILEVRVLYCKKCKKKTSQEWVRNHTFNYWRCPSCLEKQLKKKGIFMPPVASFKLIGVHKKASGVKVE